MIRGLAVCLAVINHLPTPSFYHWLSVERLGPVTGAELLVIVSGLALGVVHQQRIARSGWRVSAGALWRRSLQLYQVTLGVVLALWAVALVGGGRSAALTTWTDTASGRVYEMVPAPSLAAVADLLRLRISPWQCNVLGLYVALTALAPLALWLLARRQAPVVLAASWALYAVNGWLHLRPTGAAFETAFPLLTWQLPFVHALVVGYLRDDFVAALAGAGRRRVVAAAAVAAAALALFAWHNPWNGAPAWTRLSLITPQQFGTLYSAAVGERTWLGLGRVIDAGLVVFVLHAAVARWRSAAERVVGWFLVPLGQASLYVFVVHLAVIAMVAALPHSAHAPRLLNTAVHSAALVLLWLAVRRRLLFRWIPR